MLSLGLITWFIGLILLSGDIETNPGPVSGFLLNTRSVKSVNYQRNKLLELQALVTLKEAKIVCLTETWLSPDINDSEILPTDQFNIYRRDRDSHGGGVLVAIHSSIPSRHRPDLAPSAPDHAIELIVVEILQVHQRKMALVLVYNPPNYSNIEGASKLRESLGAIRNSGCEDVCVLGDFNLPNLDIVTNLPSSTVHSCDLFYNIFQEYSLQHKVKCSTHQYGNRLDLILCSCPEKISQISTEHDIYPSDHSLINFCLEDAVRVTKLPRSVFNYKKADWTGLKQSLLIANLDSIIYENWDNVSDACRLWTKVIVDSAKRFIPVIKINRTSPPWIDNDVVHLSKKKENARKKALRDDTPGAWAVYRRLRNNLRSVVNRKIIIILMKHPSISRLILNVFGV
jgi:hypothetical protein